MTFGIDIATPQRDIDINRAKADGVEFVIVKMGGLNVTPQYVAPYYRAQVDRVVAAGLPKGHYYLIGKGQTPEAQAEFFVKNLYRYEDGDVLALDNEALDSNGTRWGDADAARFIKRVLELTHAHPTRVWHYAGASDYRATADWPQVEAAGARIWWAAYGSYPTGKTPDHEPSLQGSVNRWDVHQYSSKVAVAGYALDGNYSLHDIGNLFGVVMPLNNYVLRSPSTVILADNRDPYVSWQNHLARTGGLRGGVDLVAAVGTPVYARTAGIMIHVPNDGSAGNSSRFHHDANSGWKDVFSHLSRYVGWSGQHFNAGDIVAYTGDSGGVAPHLHWHLVDPAGNRRNPWDYFSGSGTAGGGYEEIDMPLDVNDKNWLNGLGAAIVEQITGGGAYQSNALATIASVRRDIGHIHEVSPYSLKAIRAAQTSGGIDIDALAAKIAAAIVIPAGGGVTEAQVEAAVRRVFSDAGTA